MKVTDQVAYSTIEERLIGSDAPFALENVGLSGGGAIRAFKYAPKSVADIVRKGQKFRNEDFLLASDGKWLSYSAAFTLAGRLSDWLKANGYAGVCICLCLESDPDALIMMLGIILSGSPIFLVAPENAGSALPLLKEMGCGLVICRTASLLSAESGAIATKVIAFEPGRIDWEWHLASKTQSTNERRFDQKESTGDRSRDAIIAFTSGSTGAPKAVISTHLGVITGIMNMLVGGSIVSMRQPFPTTLRKPRISKYTSLLLSPVHHVAGYMQVLLQIMIGGRLIVREGFSSSELGNLIDANNVTSIVGTTPEIIAQLVCQVKEGLSLQSLTALHINGYAAHAKLLQEVREALPTVLITTGFGLTETNGAIAVSGGIDLRRDPASVGRILPSVNARIVGEGGELCAPGMIGSLQVSGAMLMRGYCTASGIVEMDGDWFDTGDLASISSNGVLHIWDRRKNIHSIADANLSSLDIERCIVNTLDLRDCAVLVTTEGVLHVYYVEGLIAVEVETVCALVTVRFNLSATSVVAKKRGGIPRNASGKIDYVSLRRDLESGKAVA